MGTRDDDASDENRDVRETFAYFGRAFYKAYLVEVGLSHALMEDEFLVQVKQKFVATKGEGFDRQQYEVEFDTFMEEQFKKTMGRLIRRAKTLPNFSDEMKQRIDAAKKSAVIFLPITIGGNVP
jgi:hypothetical protein